MCGSAEGRKEVRNEGSAEGRINSWLKCFHVFSRHKLYSLPYFEYCYFYAFAVVLAASSAPSEPIQKAI